MLRISHRKTLLLQNLNRGGQGIIWAVASLDGWMEIVTVVLKDVSHIFFGVELNFS
jgi:hypothetical protein